MKSNEKTKHMFLDVSECGESIFDTPDHWEDHRNPPMAASKAFAIGELGGISQK